MYFRCLKLYIELQITKFVCFSLSKLQDDCRRVRGAAPDQGRAAIGRLVTAGGDGGGAWGGQSGLSLSPLVLPATVIVRPEHRHQHDGRDEHQGDQGEGGGGGDQARVPPSPTGAVRPQQCENQGGRRTGGQRLSRLWPDHTRPVAT